MDASVRTPRRGHFWIAADRVEHDGLTYQHGPMYVQREPPEDVTRSYRFFALLTDAARGIGTAIALKLASLSSTRWATSADSSGRPRSVI
jgi:hypothetical protein